MIDSAMGGHVAEKLFIGSDKVTSGCSGDFQGLTDMTYSAVLGTGMFGEDFGYIAEDFKKLSEDMKAKVDNQVKIILKESEARVEALL